MKIIQFAGRDKLLFIFLLVLFQNASTQPIAFPGAEGFGKYATGGRGGRVVIVENLNDEGPGSFRQALQAYPGEPITVIFRVSGIIDLKTPIVIKRSNVTIAGQTAPGDGICLKGNSFIINGANRAGNHGNIIVRFIRSRPGKFIKTGLYGLDMENCHDVIIDHCSFSWANEEVVATYDTKNVTLQWCIVSEGLYDAGHQKGQRSYGGVWGGQSSSYHHNLLTHLANRTVRFNGSRAHDTIARVDYQNNINYNWGHENACYGGDVRLPGGISSVNMINNYYIPGPATDPRWKFVQPIYTSGINYGVTKWYLSGNYMEGSKELTEDNWKGLDLSPIPGEYRNQAIASGPFNYAASLKNQTAKEAYQSVIANAGAVFPSRDETDERVIKEVKNRSASGSGKYGKPGIIDTPEAVGGWDQYKTVSAPVDSDNDGMPDSWEKEKKLNPGDPDDRNKVGKNGYTMLEEYLNELVSNTHNNR